MTSLDIMTYLDPASNPGSKPQRLSDKNCKSCTMKQNTFGGISFKLLVGLAGSVVHVMAAWLYPT